MKTGKRIKILRTVLHDTHADKLLLSYIIFLLVSGLLIWIFEPTITTFRSAMWYCYAVLSTAGFGDIVVTTPLPRILSVLITIYTILVTAIVTSVFVNYYTQMNEIKNKDTLNAFMDKLEQLPELSTEELQDLSNRVIEFRKRRQQN